MLIGKPKIGVTGPDTGGTAAWLFTAIAVLISGGVPVRITPSHPRSNRKLDGLIIGGGADIDPRLYEEETYLQDYLKDSFKDKRVSLFRRFTNLFFRLSYPVVFVIRWIFSRKNPKQDKERDELELSLVHQAIIKGVPVLGICRGAQIINVYFKGDLHQEIEPFYLEEVNKASILPVKKVRINPGSKLAQILETAELMVNALHHQAVKEAGLGINIVAREENGIVQGIESGKHDFIIGVQWHPEYLIGKKEHRRIFKALVEKAVENRQ